LSDTISRVRKVQVWLYRRTDVFEILLLKLCSERGGFWQPVTGGVESGESYLEASVRELKEETGLDAEVSPLQEKFSFEKKGQRFEEHVFFAEAPRPNIAIRMDPREHIEFRWVTPDDAQKILFYDSNKKMLEILNRKVLV